MDVVFVDKYKLQEIVNLEALKAVKDRYNQVCDNIHSMYLITSSACKHCFL
jgi:hypothetical protein